MVSQNSEFLAGHIGRCVSRSRPDPVRAPLRPVEINLESDSAFAAPRTLTREHPDLNSTLRGLRRSQGQFDFSVIKEEHRLNPIVASHVVEAAFPNLSVGCA